MSENLVIIPTYNEKENIEKIIRYVFQMPMAFDILIVEDNSPDGTADIVKRLMQIFSSQNLRRLLSIVFLLLILLVVCWMVMIALERQWQLATILQNVQLIVLIRLFHSQAVLS